MRKSASIAFALLAGALALPASAAAGSADPCSAAANAGLKVVDPAGAGALYATHELRVSALPVNEDTSFRADSALAPGARRVDVQEGEGQDVPIFVRDTPGPLTISGLVYTTDPARPAGDQFCSAMVSTTVTLRPAVAPLFFLKRPPRWRAGDRSVIYPPNPNFIITLKHSAASSRLPITVRARTTRRLRLPSSGARAVSRIFAQRRSDPAGVTPPALRPCDEDTLICPPMTKSRHSKAAQVRAVARESSALFSSGLKVNLISPDGYPAPFRRGSPYRHIKTPFGADIELLQGGQRIGRLRVLANCVGYGQSSRCRFHKVTTKR